MSCFGSRNLLLVLILALFFGLVAPASAQQIMLDKFVQAGELTLYPVYKDEKTFYYLPNKPRLAVDDQGQPQFSFIRFVRNEETGASDSSTSRSDQGGGIVTALIELGVSEDQRQEAERELQVIVPGAKIKGPVSYTSGKFSLNSVFADASGDRTEQVLGIGSAPLMEGSKAAISLDLTNKGAQQLWASFDMPTPNVTFHFEMEFDGLLSPQQVSIEADYEKIYKHHIFNVGATGQVGKVILGSEIDAAFSELRRDQAIRINDANGDAATNQLTQIATKFIMDTIFKPMNENNQKLPGIGAATGGTGQSLLDKASALLKDARETAKSIQGKSKSPATKDGQCKTGDGSNDIGPPEAKPKATLKPKSGDKPKSGAIPESEVKPKLQLKKTTGTEQKTTNGRFVFTATASDIFSLEADLDIFRDHKGVLSTAKRRELMTSELVLAEKNFDRESYEFAIIGWRDAFNILPNSSSIFNTAETHRVLGDIAAARAYYQLFLELDVLGDVGERDPAHIADAEKWLQDLPAPFEPPLRDGLTNYETLVNGIFDYIHLEKLDALADSLNASDEAVAFVMNERGLSYGVDGDDLNAGRRHLISYNAYPKPDDIAYLANSLLSLGFVEEALLHYKMYYTIALHLRASGRKPSEDAAWQTDHYIKHFLREKIDELEEQIGRSGTAFESVSVGSSAENKDSNYQRLASGDLSIKHIDGLESPAAFADQSSEIESMIASAYDDEEAGKYDEARERYRAAFDIFPDPEFIYEIGNVYAELGDNAQALHHYRMSLAYTDRLLLEAESDQHKSNATSHYIRSGVKTRQFEARVAAGDQGQTVASKVTSPQKAGKEKKPSAEEAPKPESNTKTPKKAKTAQADCQPEKAKAAEDNTPVLSIVARYQFRKEKQSGMFRLNLNKFTTGTRDDNFDENIGDLSRLKNDERFFRTVNLDDDQAYDQREIVVMLNGLNSEDFDKYINFASVKLRKRHESGAETIDDIRIDKGNIDRTGRKFILLYGNKGDQNQDRWLDYEFQTSWNFAGGHEVGDSTFQVSNGEAIALTPPIEQINLQIEADPTVLAAQNVRAVNVKVFWTIGTKMDSEQVLLRLPNTSASISMLAPTNAFGYEFEVTWMRSGGLPDITSGRQAGSSQILFVDELP